MNTLHVVNQKSELKAGIAPKNELAFIPSVGQSEKIHLPTINPAPAKGLTVGRQPEKNPHTPTHAGGTFNFGDPTPNRNRHFKLGRRAENDFMQAVPLLFDRMENTAVVFHSTDFVDAVFEHYHRIHAHLFLDWVKTFALIRSSCRVVLMEGVIQTSDDDFLTALRLFKLSNTKPKQKRTVTQRQRVWNAVNQYFPDKPFTSTDLQDRTLISRESIQSLLQELREQGKLKRCRKLGHRKRYELIQKQGV